jgi:uncharacterized membrane protein
LKPHRAGFSLIGFPRIFFCLVSISTFTDQKKEGGFSISSVDGHITIYHFYQSSCVTSSSTCLSSSKKKNSDFFLFPLLSDPYRLLLLTGHSVTESSTRVRKDGDDVQQDTSGVVHDFMEPTLLAIPAHLKIDVSFFKLIAPLY